MEISKLKKGIEIFQAEKFKKYESKFTKLVEKGQNPRVLFIGCSDSRVIPSLITNTKPGDLFVVRNIGNLVPPFKPDAAAIEYAVSVLDVTEIIICGHSHCGAMKSLYQKIDNPNLIHVKKWMELAAETKKYVENTLGVNASNEEKYKMSEKISVTYQMVNLLTYPDVEKRVEEGKLNIRGWYYKLESGEIEKYDHEKNEFVPLV